ncbi:hypothetical protein AB6A40_008620 [Gnathostoma spinigerum]|uniref:G-protein coupled receptors family 1 profile domain-containing protein n=1 Tax=Gnathostoma spinigerum TaxID=75299 RepID=A0ABD6EWP1_9BILA
MIYASVIAQAIISTTAILANLFAFLVILVTRKLRKNQSNILLCSIIFGSIILQIGIFLRAIFDFAFEVIDEFVISCVTKFFLTLPVVFGLHTVNTCILFTALQTLLCVKRPVIFRSLVNTRSQKIVCAFALSYSLIGSSAMFIGADLSSNTSTTSVGDHWSDVYDAYFFVCIDVMPCITSVSFVITICLLRRRPSSDKNFYNKAMGALSMFLALYFILWFIPTLAQLIVHYSSLLSNDTEKLIGYVSNRFRDVYALMNPSLLFWKNREFREGALDFLRLKSSNQVHEADQQRFCKRKSRAWGDSDRSRF